MTHMGFSSCELFHIQKAIVHLDFHRFFFAVDGKSMLVSVFNIA